MALLNREMLHLKRLYLIVFKKSEPTALMSSLPHSQGPNPMESPMASALTRAHENPRGNKQSVDQSS